MAACTRHSDGSGKQRDPARFGAGYLQLEFTNTSMTHDKWQLQVIKGVCSQLHILKDALACAHDARQQQWRGGGD